MAGRIPGVPTSTLPTADDVLAVLRGVIDPELGSDIVELGMAKGAQVQPDGNVVVTIALTTSGCPLRAQIQRDVRARVSSLPGVTHVQLDWTEMTQEEKSSAMAKARWNVAQRPEDTSLAPTTKVVLDADIWGFSVPRMLGVTGRLAGEERDGRKMMIPHERRVGDGVLRVISMGFLVEDEEQALMWRGLMLNRGVTHFLQDVAWGDDLDYLFIDMPPGTGDVQMGVAKLLPRAEVLVITTPAQAAQKVASRAVSMARKSYLRVAGVIENMSTFTCDHGTSYSLFGEGGGAALAADAGVPLLGQIPLEPAVSTGGDDGEPVVLGDGPAADAFRAIAERLLVEAIPPAEMAGCSARMLDAAVAALDALD